VEESRDIAPEHWPDDIKSVLDKLTEEDKAIIVDHMIRSYMAGYFDGEGSVQVQKSNTVPSVGSQDMECLMLFQKKYGGNIVLQYEKGAESSKGIIVNKDCYIWTMTSRHRGPGGRGYVEKTEFLLKLLPYQHNLSKIDQSIRAIVALGWSARVRWEHLIPKDVDICLPEDDRVPADELFDVDDQRI